MPATLDDRAPSVALLAATVYRGSCVQSLGLKRRSMQRCSGPARSTGIWPQASEVSVDGIRLRPVTYAELSGIRHEIFTSEERPSVTPECLIIRYFGTYRHGASGRGDALYIIATAEAARKAWYSRCTVLDFQGLEYTWGDEMEWVTSIGWDRVIQCHEPLGIVVARGVARRYSPSSEPSTRSSAGIRSSMFSTFAVGRSRNTSSGSKIIGNGPDSALQRSRTADSASRGLHTQARRAGPLSVFLGGVNDGYCSAPSGLDSLDARRTRPLDRRAPTTASGHRDSLLGSMEWPRPDDGSEHPGDHREVHRSSPVFLRRRRSEGELRVMQALRCGEYPGPRSPGDRSSPGIDHWLSRSGATCIRDRNPFE